MKPRGTLPATPRSRTLRRAIAGALCACLCAQAQADDTYHASVRNRFETDVEKPELKPGLTIEPRIESALMFVGNINLAEDSEDEVDVAGIEAAPGIYATYYSPRAQGALDYTFIGRVFEDSDYNDVSHRLAANGSYTLMPDWFYVRGQASYTDTIIDPALGYNYGGVGLFNETNLVEVASALVEPAMHHQFRNVAVDARYSYGRVWYLDSPDAPSNPLFAGYNDDAENQRALLSFSTVDPEALTTARAYYEWQASDYETSLPYRYERVGAELGIRLLESLRLVGDGGLESDLDENTTDGGLDVAFWHAGFQWRPDSKTLLDARYGERFFGDSWSVEISREASWLTIKGSYIEDPEVETRRLNAEFDPGSLPLPGPDPGFSFYSSFPYVRKDATLALIATGARTKLRLDVYDLKREFINFFPPDERTQGVRFNALRDLGTSNLYLELDARYDDVERGRRNLDITDTRLVHDYDSEAMLRLSWEAYKNFVGSAEAGFLTRSGDRNYDGEWLAFRLRYTF